jgi:hypothetical protein
MIKSANKYCMELKEIKFVKINELHAGNNKIDDAKIVQLRLPFVNLGGVSLMGALLD